MVSTRDITRRIKSVKNTKKVTKAMELVSAAKMRKAVETVLKTRSYANLSWLTVMNLAKVAATDSSLHELLNRRPEIKKVGIILITSNRGLCGGFNSNIINKTIRSLERQEGAAAEFILLGKKGAVMHRRFGFNLAAEFNKPDVVTQVAEVLPAAKMVIKDYLKGRYDKIMVAYTDFVSAVKQVPRVKQLLPIDLTPSPQTPLPEGEGLRADTDITEKIVKEKQEKYFINQEYVFEPNPKDVLNEMIPRLLEIQMFQALLESNASEHSARMVAMRNATDAADDMIDDLTLYYNKARQANITREIAEVVGGAAALQS